MSEEIRQLMLQNKNFSEDNRHKLFTLPNDGNTRCLLISFMLTNEAIDGYRSISSRNLDT